jgi:hypothetical protein
MALGLREAGGKCYATIPFVLPTPLLTKNYASVLFFSGL